MADYAEYGQGPMPGKMLLLRLMKFTGEFDPEWYVGKDLAALQELMEIDKVAELAARAGRLGPGKLSDAEQVAYRTLGRMRDADPDKYHGELGIVAKDQWGNKVE